MKTADSLCADVTWVGRADCRHCRVRSMMLFADLDATYLDNLLAPIDNMVFETGAVIYSEGEGRSYIYSVRSGRAKQVSYGKSGQERIVRLNGVGDAIGLEAWVGKPYQHTAIALQKMDVCRIPVNVLKRINNEVPLLSRQLFSRWEAALEQADFWITSLSTGPTRKRVIRLIHFLIDRDNVPNAIVRLLKAEDMAAMLGTSKETVSRIMSELKNIGVLSRIAPRTYICDMAALDSYEYQ